ncbi:efflux RND transporter periplasmic adaptor subunit [Thermoflexus sp.]|uniref:HlyD family secretion protein n=1 Tax=Thermoflexus sp. TaxID=1969742 RepID=UPI0025F23009|nr:efflux RND transporter periplasmic adaptor subunit [Thermoflexus sp.]MCS6963264.1 efflux RND transporter periplasmic adaptor subunit [Thermoflexus sp.]MCX7689343.1 efflux RND transporter periplasmic adaptor subunit [Thermoflexus sp.]MDW8185728.1 efflux RND transporter periplasmic adaptor subunit [Anaerolineae bacterium]
MRIRGKLRAFLFSLLAFAIACQPGIERPLRASGYLEAQTIDVIAVEGGRVLQVWVEEGEAVQAGQPLMELDPAFLEAQIRMAEAQVAQARAALEALEAGPRDEDVREAMALVDQAQALRDGTYQAWQDALVMWREPQELQIQRAVAAAQARAAQARLEQAVAMKEIAEILKNRAEAAIRDWEQLPPNLRPPLPGEVRDAPYAYWAAWAEVNRAGVAYDGSRALRDYLDAVVQDPLTLRIQVVEAEGRYRAAEAALEAARARLVALRAGATREQREAARARLRQAEAALEALKARRGRYTLQAPQDGIVALRAVEPGELVAPGTRVMQLMDLRILTLTVYIPETALGRVRPGMNVPVMVEGFPDERFEGLVTHIAEEASFTPRQVQTQEERVHLTFAARIRLENPEGRLKPGMPADVEVP